MGEFLRDDPLLLLAVVVTVGFLLGRLRVFGFSLGVSGVLFAGLAIGAVDPTLRLPEFVYEFGLALFVYTIGLSSGPGFFRGLRRRGLRDNLLVLGAILVAGVLVAGLALALDLPPTIGAGLFTGGTTNTPALGGVLETLKLSGASEQVLGEPVVAYAIAYPYGVIGMLLGIYLCQRIWKVDYRAEARRVQDSDIAAEPLVSQTVEIVREDLGDGVVKELGQAHHVTFGRRRRGDEVVLVSGGTSLQAGDLVSVIGAEENVRAAVQALGRPSDEPLALDRKVLDFRRMFVSNSKVTGRRLHTLGLTERFGATVTRVRRGDVDLVADDGIVLEPGDRVRVVAPRHQMGRLARFFGDSYRAVSEVNMTTFGLGIALGLLLGSIPIPLPAGGEFQLGFAGGPLLVGLVLGALGRTGPVSWSMSYGANMTLRQLGVVLFMAGIGPLAGSRFASALGEGGGIWFVVTIAGAGMIVTTMSVLLVMVVGYKVLKIPMGLLTGMLAGLQTQPAVLAFAVEQSRDELPNVGYASVYPVAMISKIIIAQVLLVMLPS